MDHVAATPEAAHAAINHNQNEQLVRDRKPSTKLLSVSVWQPSSGSNSGFKQATKHTVVCGGDAEAAGCSSVQTSGPPATTVQATINASANAPMPAGTTASNGGGTTAEARNVNASSTSNVVRQAESPKRTKWPATNWGYKSRILLFRGFRATYKFQMIISGSVRQSLNMLPYEIGSYQKPYVKPYSCDACQAVFFVNVFNKQRYFQKNPENPLVDGEHHHSQTCAVPPESVRTPASPAVDDGEHTKLRQQRAVTVLKRSRLDENDSDEHRTRGVKKQSLSAQPPIERDRHVDVVVDVDDIATLRGDSPLQRNGSADEPASTTQNGSSSTLSTILDSVIPLIRKEGFECELKFSGDRVHKCLIRSKKHESQRSD